MYPLEYIGGRKFILGMFVISLLAFLLMKNLIQSEFLKEIVLLIVGFYFGVNSAEKQKYV